jgi:hypothetical protein
MIFAWYSSLRKLKLRKWRIYRKKRFWLRPADIQSATVAGIIGTMSALTLIIRRFADGAFPIYMVRARFGIMPEETVYLLQSIR